MVAFCACRYQATCVAQYTAYFTGLKRTFNERDMEMEPKAGGASFIIDWDTELAEMALRKNAAEVFVWAFVGMGEVERRPGVRFGSSWKRRWNYVKMKELFLFGIINLLGTS
jgi:hypothetical protein